VRTLIVDDNEAVRVGLSQLLGSREFCELVGAVGEPDEAIELTRTRHPHVVLQDFSMPGHDVIELVRTLSACEPRPTVLMLSAFADAPSARRAIDAGAIGWVLKDAEPEQIFAALLGAAGVRDHSRAAARADGAPNACLLTAVPTPEIASDDDGSDHEIATPLDARTVWALLRALQGAPAGLTVEDLANRAVLPLAVAARYLQRLRSRHPALVELVRGQAALRLYTLTVAGHAELARLERRIPEAMPEPTARRHFCDSR
jgi:CheY-like chemotaxis protein